MSHPYIYHGFILKEIPFSLKNKKVLGVGCSRGMWGYFIRTEREDENPYPIGLDIVNILITADSASLPFRDSACDLILEIEVIERLAKSKGFQFLSEVERDLNTPRKIILTTPLAYIIPQIGRLLTLIKCTS